MPAKWWLTTTPTTRTPNLWSTPTHHNGPEPPQRPGLITPNLTHYLDHIELGLRTTQHFNHAR